jgi:flavodoxin
MFAQGEDVCFEKTFNRRGRLLRVTRLNLMKALVVYDSVSPMKLTAKIAETIAEVLKEKGIDVDLLYVRDVDKAAIKNYDCLIAGAPTMALRVSSAMRQFLDGLPRKGFSGKLAAAFDTQMQSRFSGNAAKGIEGKLKDRGFKVIAAQLVAYVEGKMNEYHLKDGELDKTKDWSQTVAETLSK